MMDDDELEDWLGPEQRMTQTYYEFFAGGGMARAGLGAGWDCLFANDFDVKKAVSYRVNWGDDGRLKVGDVANVTTDMLPGMADLAWASFPCQDLSVAGSGAGLEGERSGTFWSFWKLMLGLGAEGRAPRLVVLENVLGALTSHDGADFAAIGDALVSGGYRFGALVIDAVHFLPQSRPRLFIVAIRASESVADSLLADGPSRPWHTGALVAAHGRLSEAARRAWLWWRLPEAPERHSIFADLVEAQPKGVKWNSWGETRALLAMMSLFNMAKVSAAKESGRRMVGTVYRRTRIEKGCKVQRAEVRFDDVAGCLRTPAGGSSRQTIMIIDDGGVVRSRLLSPRELARLMGLSDDYVLPRDYNEAYHLFGDGVAVPVVRFLAANLLEIAV